MKISAYSRGRCELVYHETKDVPIRFTCSGKVNAFTRQYYDDGKPVNDEAQVYDVNLITVLLQQEKVAHRVENGEVWVTLEGEWKCPIKYNIQLTAKEEPLR